MIRIVSAKNLYPIQLPTPKGERSFEIILPITLSEKITIDIEILTRTLPLSFYISLYDEQAEEKIIEMFSEYFLKKITYSIEKRTIRRMVFKLPLDEAANIALIVKLKS